MKMVNQTRETYISVDIEASGPVPGLYSMLSLGACVIGSDTQNFYVELKPLTRRHTTEAMKVNGLNLARLQKHGVDPCEAIQALAKWVKSVARTSTPVFVGFNAPFDWSFVNYYCHLFLN